MAPPANAAVDRLHLMETFIRIVEAGSLSAAAAQMNTTQPTVSRRLQALERSFGVRLLQRSTHAMRLTIDGERCYERAKELMALWSAFETDLRGVQEEPEGMLRVAMPHAFGQERFIAPLAGFLHANPRVTVEWLLQDDNRDFIGGGIDCAVQAGEPKDPAVVAIRLTEVPRIVVAAPSLLGQAGALHQPADLAALPWLALHTFYRNDVTLRHEETGELQKVTFTPRMSTDSLYALRSAAVAGLGACVGSTWLLAEDIAQGRLVRLLPQWQAMPLPVYIAYPYATFYPSRLLKFVSAMREQVPGLVNA